MPFPEEVQNKTKTSSSTSKQKHIFRFDKNPIDSSCFQVPDSGFKFQDLAVARISLVHSTATYKDRGKVRYLQCFLLRYGSLSTLQDAPGELQKLLGWILGGGGGRPYIYMYVRSFMLSSCICTCISICICVCMCICMRTSMCWACSMVCLIPDQAPHLGTCFARCALAFALAWRCVVVRPRLADR